MHPQLQTICQTRTALVALIKDLTTEELNEIPAGFNNNIIWNLAHVTAVQQNVCYFRSGLPIRIKEPYFTAYKPDTKPGNYVDSTEVEIIKQMLFISLDQLQTDYENNFFTNYTPWTTRNGIDLNTIDDAINFLPFHEGLHMGYIMALKRVVTNPVPTRGL